MSAFYDSRLWHSKQVIKTLKFMSISAFESKLYFEELIPYAKIHPLLRNVKEDVSPDIISHIKTISTMVDLLIFFIS